MLNDKYGDLLDRVIDKKVDSSAIGSADRFRDGINKQKQEMIDNHNRIVSEREQRDIEEQQRLERQNDFINSMIDRTKSKIDADNERRQAAQAENKRRMESRRAVENLTSVDRIVAQNKARIAREQAEQEMKSKRKW